MTPPADNRHSVNSESTVLTIEMVRRALRTEEERARDGVEEYRKEFARRMFLVGRPLRFEWF